MTEVVPNDTELADDLLPGADEIAKFIGINRRRVYWFIEKGTLPHRKCGELIVGSRSAIRQALIPSPKIPANAA